MAVALVLSSIRRWNSVVSVTVFCIGSMGYAVLGSRIHGLHASSKRTEIPAGFMSLSVIPFAFHTHTRRLCSGTLSTLKSTFSKLEKRCIPETLSSTFA